MRRTRMWSAATSGAGGHDAPLGQLAASSAWTSAALERPLTTMSAVTSRSPRVAMRQVGLGQQQADVQLGPGLDLEGGLLAVVQEGRREAEAAAVLVDDLGGGAGAGEEARIEVGQLGHQGPADDDAGGAGLHGERGWRRGRPSPSTSSCACAMGAYPARSPAQGAGSPSPPRARQMPRDVRATTRASTARSATAITTVTMKRENHVAS